jgi:hypothetical protein
VTFTANVRGAVRVDSRDLFAFLARRADAHASRIVGRVELDVAIFLAHTVAINHLVKRRCDAGNLSDALRMTLLSRVGTGDWLAAVAVRVGLANFLISAITAEVNASVGILCHRPIAYLAWWASTHAVGESSGCDLHMAIIR